jgi:hypothetical protein
MKKHLLLAFAFILGAGVAMAQVTTSAINGKILDSKGESLAGATIQVLYKPTNTSYGVIANEEGRYLLVNLTPGGPYEVTITFVGYKSEKFEDLFLKLGETLKLDAQLKDDAQQLNEVVVLGVNQDASEKTGTGTAVSREQITTLPTLTRSFSDFTRLTPQSSNNSFAGTNFRYNNITLDGAINNDAIGFSPSLGGISGTANQPGSSTRTNSFSLDAIQQVQVQIAPYDVSLGNFTGGSINAVSRSGSNNVTGSVYGFARGASITGKYKGDDKVGDGSIASSYYDYQTGFRLGFPLIKDKLFWFTNEEVTKNSVPVFFPANSPGYFMNQTLTQLDAKANANGLVPNAEAVYANMSLADAISTKLTGMQPSTYNPAGGFDPGATGSYSIFSKSVKFFNRIDWVINKNHTLAIRNNSIVSSASNLERSTTEFQFGSYDFTQHNTNTSTVAELKSRFGNNTANSLIVGYTDIKDYRDPSAIFPQVQINGISGGHVLLGANREAGIFNMRQRTFEFTDNLKYFFGNHTLTLGTHNELYKINYGFINSWNGRFDYSSVDNFLQDTPSRMRALYNATDNSRATQYTNSANVGQFNILLASLYAQDQWIKNNWTFTYGLRADMPVMPTGPNGSARANFPTSPTGYGSTFTYDNPSTVSTNYFSQLYVSPRIGFNYDVKGDQSVILRGGSGLFTGRIPFAWIGYTFINNGSSFNALDLNPPKAGTAIPTDQTQFGAFAAANGSKNRTEIDLLDKNFSLPRMWRSNIAVDFALGNGYKLTLEALYTKTIKDVMIKQVNLKDSAIYATYDVNQVQPLYLSGGATANRVSNNFSSVYLITNTDKGYRYQLTAQISKSYPFGLSFMAAYTYGQSKDVLNGIRNSPESGWQTNQGLNANNLGLAYSNFDIRHRIVSTIQYKKAWGTSGASYVSLIPTFQSGSPFTYGITSSNNLTKNGQQVDMFYIPKVGEDPYHLNTADASGAMNTAFNNFIDNDTYLSKHRGEFTQRNGARTPWNNQLDLRLMHDFYFKAGQKTNTLQLTFDIINFSNMINKYWGVYYFTPNTINSSVDPGLAITTRTYNAATNTYDIYGKFATPTSKWSIDQFSSRWQAQVGVRYIF